MLEQKRVLDEEVEWIAVPRARFDPFIIDRELREYEIADKIIVSSEAVRLSFPRQRTDASRVAKVPYGAEISQFSTPTEECRSGAIVSVATIGLRKGHHPLHAFQMLWTRNKTPTVVGFISAGYGRDLNLDQPAVRMTRPVSWSGVIRELQPAFIFVLASIEEGLALVIAQAKACCPPVISTEATGPRETITDGVEGRIVPGPVSAENVVQAIDYLLSDNVRSHAMGAAARRKVEAIGWE